MKIDKKKEEILQRCNYLFINDIPLKEMIDKRILEILDSGFIDYRDYDFKEDGYQLMKLLNYLALKRVAESFKPLDTQYMKKYKSLIKHY